MPHIHIETKKLIKQLTQAFALHTHTVAVLQLDNTHKVLLGNWHLPVIAYINFFLPFSVSYHDYKVAYILPSSASAATSTLLEALTAKAAAPWV